MSRIPADRALTVFVPGLFGAESVAVEYHRRLPGIETLCARAERRAGGPEGFPARAFALFGVAAAAPDLPVAAVTRIADTGNIDRDAAWLRADPVYLHADRGRLILAGADSLDIARDEATALRAEMAEVFAPENLALECPHPHRWYLRLPAVPDIRTHAPGDALGHDIHAYLPQGADGGRWRRLFNEIQMVLHASPVNAAREARGAPPINSLWLWGGGALPEAIEASFSQVWAAEPLARGLALLARRPCAEPVADAETWLREALTPGRHLVVLEDARRSVEYADTAAWSRAMEALDARWFAPLGNALRAGELESLTLLGDRGPAFRLGARDLRRWWRRRRPLSEYQ